MFDPKGITSQVLPAVFPDAVPDESLVRSKSTRLKRFKNRLVRTFSFTNPASSSAPSSGESRFHRLKRSFSFSQASSNRSVITVAKQEHSRPLSLKNISDRRVGAGTSQQITETEKPKSVERWSLFLKTTITIPSPDTDPTGHDLAMNAYVKSDQQLWELWKNMSESEKKNINTFAEIRPVMESCYKEHRQSIIL